LSIDNAPEPTAHFVERESIPLNNLYEKLNKYHRIIITGLPGVGKTEFVRQVMEQAIKETKYKGIFWLSAATEQMFEANIYSLAHDLSLLEDPNMNGRERGEWKWGATAIADWLISCRPPMSATTKLVADTSGANQRRPPREVVLITRSTGNRPINSGQHTHTIHTRNLVIDQGRQFVGRAKQIKLHRFRRESICFLCF
jgi:hypothetical protein